MGRWLRVVVVVALLALVTASAGLPVDAAPGVGVEMERVLVMLHPGPGDPGEVARGLVEPLGGSVGFVYRHALRGFSAQLPAGAVTALRRHPQVALVSRIGWWWPSARSCPPASTASKPTATP